MEQFKGFVHDMVNWRDKFNRRNPIEILKRLQREAFSDIMKLRDRQEKVERTLTFYKTSKGNPFQNYNTNVRGEIDVAGAVLVINNIDQQQHYDAVQKAGIRTGINSRLTFESTIRQNNTLVAEIVGRENELSDISSISLSLSKVLYAANVSEWFSAVAIPVGAQFRDVGVGTSNHQERGLTDYSGFEPPLLNEYNGSALGITVRDKNVAASLGQFVSGLGMQATNSGVTRCFSTFGQVVCQVSNTTKLSLLGVHKARKSSPQSACLGPMAIPIRISRQNEHTEASLEGDNGPQTDTNGGRTNVDGSVALIVESKLDESSRIGGWIEKKSNPRCVQWAVAVSDTPEDEFGWGLSLGGLVKNARNWDHFQAEAFLKFNFGKKFSLQPSLVYVSDGSTQFPALMCRSSWSI